jgi:hypothetical protein
LLKTSPSRHTELSKPVYIAFLEEFLSELTPKEQSRGVGALMARVSLPNINKPN